MINDLKFAKRPTASNTTLSDLNELLIGYLLNKEQWFSVEAKRQHDKRVREVTQEQYTDIVFKSEAMVEEFLKTARSFGFKGDAKEIYWTARKNDLSKAVGYEVDQAKNPTDILVRFFDGPNEGFLGISAKVSKTNKDVAFKNLGIGTIDKLLKSNLAQQADKEKKAFLKAQKGLPTTGPKAKKLLADLTTLHGTMILEKLRDSMFKTLNKMQQDDLYKFIIRDVLNADGAVPKYVKVTGVFVAQKYAARVENPNKNKKTEALLKNKIKLSKVGTSGVLVKAGSEKIVRLRIKWNSGAIVSSLTVTSDPG